MAPIQQFVFIVTDLVKKTPFNFKQSFHLLNNRPPISCRQCIHNPKLHSCSVLNAFKAQNTICSFWVRIRCMPDNVLLCRVTIYLEVCIMMLMTVNYWMLIYLNVLLAVCEGGTVFHPSILDITDEDILSKFSEVSIILFGLMGLFSWNCQNNFSWKVLLKQTIPDWTKPREQRFYVKH